MAEVYDVTLDEFEAAHLTKPQVWGQVDCCLVLADWLMWLGAADPSPHLRGTYDSEAGCRAVVRAAGGLVPLVEGCNARAGWQRVQRPVSVGDVGVIGAANNVDRQWGAIWSGTAWRVRLSDRFESLIAKPLAVWSR